MAEPVWKYEKEVVVISGGWNANILLNKDWLKKYLFPKQDKFTIEFPLVPVAYPPRISTDHMRISIAGQRLCFAPLMDDLSQLEEIVDVVMLVADFLPHTPVTAMGINFFYELDDEELVSRCRSSVATDVFSKIGDIREEYFQFSLSAEKGCLNLNLRRPLVDVNTYKNTCEFNYHHTLTCLADVKEILADSPIIALKNKADNLLKSIITDLREGTV